MKKNNGKKIMSESDVDSWIDTVDLSRTAHRFKPITFPNLKKTDWVKFYERQQKTQPVSLRLPQFFIHQIKQKSVGLGIPYQYLIRLWIAEKLGFQTS